MNIKKISYGLIGTLLTVGGFSSCNNKYENKAKAEAVQYLNGDELLKAERFAKQQHNQDTWNGDAISYWDSLLIETKSKEAYLKGQQIIKDSVNRIYHRKEKFIASLDTIINGNVIENSRKEYANYVNAKDFIKARDKAPSDYDYFGGNHFVNSTHYWNLITIAGKQKEAYEKGMIDARKELEINK